jgi:hypothetical protein
MASISPAWWRAPMLNTPKWISRDQAWYSTRRGVVSRDAVERSAGREQHRATPLYTVRATDTFALIHGAALD